MPLVYPKLSAKELNDLLKRSQWVKFKYNVEVIDELGVGRGVRVMKEISKGNVICWYSTDVFDILQDDMVYQYQDGNLFACVSNYEGRIQFGVLINDNMTGVPNCEISFSRSANGKKTVAKVIALETLYPGELLSLEYGAGYWAYILSHFSLEKATAARIMNYLKMK